MRPLVVLLPLFAAAAFAQPVSGPSFPGSLKAYLTLTDAQVESIGRLNGTYDQFSAQKQQRMEQVRADLAGLTRADPIDSLALGVRYAEIEAIRRDLAGKLEELRADISGILTGPQRVKLQSLDDEQLLLGMASEAECQNLLPGPYPGIIVPVLSGSGSGSAGGTIGGIILAPGQTLFPTGLPCGITPGFPADLTAYLGLSTGQLDSVNRLNADYSRFVAEKQQRIAQVQLYIAEKTAAEVLDPGPIGQGYAEIEAIQRDLRDKLSTLRSDLAKLMTAPQQRVLAVLADGRGFQPLIVAAQCENLLAPPAVNQWFNTSGLLSGPAVVQRNGDFSGLIANRYCGI